MAVKIWNLDDSANLTSGIRRMGRSGMETEEFRPQAEVLDSEIDRVLDEAIVLLNQQDTSMHHSLFAKRWAIGRAIAESEILDSTNFETGDKPDLWLGMARKCRLGVRHTGEREPKSKWRGLIPEREMEPKRIEDDIFGMGTWLQEQEFSDAKLAFGGGLHNAKQIWSGEALRSKNFKDALAAYFSGFEETDRDYLYRIPKYAVLAKALRRRFPSRGRGSAKRPIHYGPAELLSEIQNVLNPLTGCLLRQLTSENS